MSWKPFSTFLLLSFSLNLFAQVRKEVDNGIFVTFPISPEYQVNNQTTTYTGKSENCLFMTIVLRNQFPNYPQYVQAKMKWTKAEIKKIEDLFLDNAIIGKLGYTGNKGNATEVKIGEFSGRKIDYSAINPATGERGKRFTIMLFVRDKLINFECWYLKENENSKQEKDEFLNSINTY